MIYNKYTFGRQPKSGPRAPERLGIKNNKGVFCYVNKVTIGKSLDNLRLRSGCQENQPHD